MSITTFKLPDTFSDSGNLQMLKDSAAISQNLGLLLQTDKGELLLNPAYGSSFYIYKYTPNTNVLEDQVRDDIVTAVYLFDDRIDVNERDITITRQDEEVIVNVKYYLKNKGSSFIMQTIL